MDLWIITVGCLLRIALGQLALDATGLVRELAGALGIVLDGDREHVAGLDARGQQGSGHVDGLAVVGQEDGDVLALAFEAVDGQRQSDGHAARSFRPGGLT
jgi:hypothetical protein